MQYFSLLLIQLVILKLGFAQDSIDIKIPDFKLLRAAENYSALKHTSSEGLWYKLKYIPLRKQGFMTLGGDWRSVFQWLQNENWIEKNDDVALFQRYMLHHDLHLGKHFRLFTQLKSGLTFGRNGVKLPFDTDYLDLHQLFVGIQFGKSTIEIGRRELLYGARRLISIREGTNIRQSFDGLRWQWRANRFSIDLLSYAYNPQDTGFFDNTTDFSQLLWGAYAKWDISKTHISSLETYYLGYRNESPSFEEGSSLEIRHSLGLRHAGIWKKLHYNNEAVLQFGSFGSSTILAWTVSFDLSLKLKKELSAGLKVDIISGDRQVADQKLGTFNALYPRGGYFGLLALIGPANLMDIHPSVQITPTQKLSIQIDGDFFWRHQLADGIYFPSGRLNQSSRGSTSRHIGYQLGLQSDYRINRFLEVEASYFLFFPGGFIKDISDGSLFSQFGASIYFKF